MLPLAVPFLVGHYLSHPCFSSDFKSLSIFLGLLWICLSFAFNFGVADFLGIIAWDAYGHDLRAHEFAELIRSGGWEGFFYNLTFGNRCFEMFVGLLYALTGVSVISVSCLSGFLAFWGILMLCRYLGVTFGRNIPASLWLLYLMICPNLVFWGNMLMKEGPMFWGICLWFTSTVPASANEKFSLKISSVIGLTVGTAMRPYSMIMWVASVGVTIIILSRRRRLTACLCMIGIMLLSVFAFKDQFNLEHLLDVQDMAQESAVFHSNLEGEGASSNIAPGGGAGLFFVSGAISMFLRPFPWNIRALRIVASSLEIWTMTLLIFMGWSWVLLHKRLFGQLIRQPPILVSVLVCIGYSIMFTFVVNEGHLARLRIQAFPALFTLAYWPLCLKQVIKKSTVVARSQSGERDTQSLAW
jgi:hypothetical protein